MAEHVEGDWKNFTIKMIKPEDFGQVLEHLAKVFYRDEALFKLAGYTDEFAAEANAVAREWLAKSQGDNSLSFFAVEKNTNKVAGVRITFAHHKSVPEPEIHPQTPQYKKIITFVGIMAEKLNCYSKFNVDQYAELLLTSVDPEFRGQGLVTEFYVRSLRLLQAKGFPLVKCTVSSPYTLKAVQKLGFKEMERMFYAQAKEADGRQLFPNATEDQHLCIMAKTLPVS